MQCSHIALRVKEENEHDMQSGSQPDTLPLSPSSSTLTPPPSLNSCQVRLSQDHKV